MFLPGLKRLQPKGEISTQLSALQKDVRALRPARSHGTLTSQTTMGTFRRASGSTWKRAKVTAEAEARWA